MSVTLLNLFTNAFKQNLPRLPTIKTGVLARVCSVMEAIKNNEQLDDNNIVPNKDSTRYRKRKFRLWEDGGRKGDDGSEEKKDKQIERVKRKKMALILGYCGQNYYGMQRNPGVPTIEEDLLKALFDAKYISEDEFKNPQNAQFQRSSRTDKGVSAVRQVVSMKLPLEINIDEINTRLPSCIKVYGLQRVTQRFNSKSNSDARTYSYTLPTYTFEPKIETDEQRKKYRITSDKMEKLNSLLGIYKGTKNYHNFTTKKFFHDPSASRYMMGFTIEKTFVECDMEFAVLVVKGQSFMLHQIRKMIGLIIAVMRGKGEMSLLDRVFTKEKIILPTAPGLGLMLESVHYDRYNTRYKETHSSLTYEEYEEAAQKFKHEFIYPNIVKEEIEGKSIAIWLEEKLAGHSYDPADNEKKGDENDDLFDDDDEDDDKGELNGEYSKHKDVATESRNVNTKSDKEETNVQNDNNIDSNKNDNKAQTNHN